MNKKSFEELKELIQKNRFKDCLGKLKELYPNNSEVSSLFSRLERINKNKIRGTLRFEDENVELARITSDILAFIDLKKGQNGSLTNDYFIDERNGKKYKTLNINGKIWLGEDFCHINDETNEKIEDWDEMVDDESYPNWYKDKEYTWDEAMILCPKGWHLPSREEWEEIFMKYGGFRTITNMLGIFRIFQKHTNLNDRGNNLEKAYRSLISGGISGFNLTKKRRYWTSTTNRYNDDIARAAYCIRATQLNNKGLIIVDNRRADYSNKIRYIKNY